MRGSISFAKVQGTGNDFLLVQKQQLSGFSEVELLNWLKLVCHRNFGVGADGVVLFEKNLDVIDWTFFNPDGSKANFCGNAARATANYFLRAEGKNSIELKLNKMRVLGFLKDELPGIRYQIANTTIKSINLDEHGLRGVHINTGVPHFVCETKNIEDWYKKKAEVFLAMTHKAFSPEGANITFFKKINSQKISVQTFERGVNDFTLSCGSGVVAAALVFLEHVDGEIEVETAGGELKVKYQPQKNEVELIGEAKTVFLGEWKNI